MHLKSHVSTGSTYDIPVSSMIVAANSVYFLHMLTSGLHESNSKQQPIDVTLSPNGEGIRILGSKNLVWILLQAHDLNSFS